MFFPPCVVSWVESFCRHVCGGLERQSGTGLRYLLTITLAPIGLVNVCTVQVIIVEERGHIPPPPPICIRGPGIYRFSTFSARGRLSRGIHHFSTFVGGGVF